VYKHYKRAELQSVRVVYNEGMRFRSPIGHFLSFIPAGSIKKNTKFCIIINCRILKKNVLHFPCTIICLRLDHPSIKKLCIKVRQKIANAYNSGQCKSMTITIIIIMTTHSLLNLECFLMGFLATGMCSTLSS